MIIDKILKEASICAEEAAKKQLEVLEKNGSRYSVHESDLLGNTGPAIDTLLDDCGGAYLTLEGRDPVIRQLKKIGKSDPAGQSYDGGFWTLSKSVYKGYNLSISCPTKSRRQEMSVHEEAMKAASEVLEKYGIKARVKTYID